MSQGVNANDKILPLNYLCGTSSQCRSIQRQTRIPLEAAYLGEDPRKHLEGSRGETGGQVANNGRDTKQVTTVGTWGLIPLGHSGSPCRTHTSESLQPEGEGAGAPLRQPVLG